MINADPVRHRHHQARAFSSRLIASAAAGALAALAATPARAVLVYESAEMGPIGQSTGAALGSTSYVGVRFQLLGTTTVDRVGAHIGRGVLPEGTVFGALVQLSGPSDFPDTGNLSTPDVLRTTILTLPAGSDEVVEKFAPATLGAGWYAAVFGSGLFGASGSGFVPMNNPQYGTPSYIGRFDPNTTWQNIGNSDMRFVVGTPQAKYWVGPLSGGTWSGSVNWSPGGIPQPAEDVGFDVNAAFSISMTADASFHDYVSDAARVTLAMNGHTMTVTGDVTLGNDVIGGAQLNLQNGALAIPAKHEIVIGGTSVASMTLASNAHIDGIYNATLTVGKDHPGTLTVGNAVVNTNYGRVADDEGQSVGVITGSGTVNLNSGGWWNVNKFFLAGRNGAALVNINSGGSLLVNQGVKIFDTAGTQVNLQGGNLRTPSLDTSGNPSRFNWSGGMLELTNDFSISASGGLGNNVAISSGKTFYCHGNLTNDGTFSQSGGATYVLGENGLTGNGTTTVTGGTVTALRIRQQSVTIGGSGVVSLTASNALATSTTSRTGPITVTGSGKLDISNKKLILPISPEGTWNGSAYTGTIGQIASGLNGGPVGTKWQGSGIVTSQTDATTADLTSIGIATGFEAFGTNSSVLWGGEFVSGTSVLVAYTYAGDANLDGNITGDDYFQIDSGFPQGLHGWVNGDFNYDGVINGDDYFLIDSNFPAQGAPFPTSGAAGSATSVTPVPEPAGTVVLVGLAATACRLLGRKRRDGV